MSRDNQYRKYYEARLWIVEAHRTCLDPHRFAVLYAESDWDDVAAAWEDLPGE